jgi:hypothetical protein
VRCTTSRPRNSSTWRGSSVTWGSSSCSTSLAPSSAPAAPGSARPARRYAAPAGHRRRPRRPPPRVPASPRRPLCPLDLGRVQGGQPRNTRAGITEALVTSAGMGACLHSARSEGGTQGGGRVVSWGRGHRAPGRRRPAWPPSTRPRRRLPLLRATSAARQRAPARATAQHARRRTAEGRLQHS